MSRMRATVIAGWFALAAVGVGCSFSEKAPIDYYTIGPEFGSLPDGRPLAFNLGIEPLGGAADIDGHNLLVRDHPDVRRYQTYLVTQLWSTLPSTMVTQVALSRLGERFANTEIFPGSYEADCILRGEVTRFEEVRTATSSQAVVRIRYRLFLRADPTAETRFDRVYVPAAAGWFVAQGEAPLPARSDLHDGIELTRAIGRAAADAVDQIAASIDRLHGEGRFPSTQGEFRGP